MARNGKQNYSRKGKFTNRRKDSKESTDSGKSASGVAEQKYNDPSWYNAHDQLMKDVASLSFNTPLGNTQWVSANGINSAPQFGLSLPGIMSIFTVPAVSPSSDGTSPINIAAKNLYSYVRHQNSGHSNYDSPDLMMYILAMDSIYSFISYMQKLYGTAMVFSQKNRYIGDALLTANCARAADIRANLANFRAYINQYIIKASAFCVPSTMSLFKRHFWMYSNAFKDEATTKSQLYCYVPAFLWMYNLDENNVGFLDPLEVGCAHNGQYCEKRELSLAEIESIGDSLLAQLQYSEDINIMSGDILKAYGREGLWTMDLIPEGYGIFPVYSEEILDQIHNTVFASARPCIGTVSEHTPSTDAFKVTQRTTIGDGALLYSPKFLYANHLGWDHVLDMHSEDPTPEEVMVATRNMLCGTVSTVNNNESFAALTTCASDICLFACVWMYNNGTLSGTYEYHHANAINTVGLVATLSKFNKYPRVYYFPTGYTAASAPEGIIGEIDNFTIVDREDISKMHETAMLNMLGVPTLGLVR